MTGRTCVFALVCVLCVVVATAHADNITIKWTGTYYTAGGVTVWGAGETAKDIGGGVIRFTVCDTPPPGGEGEDLVLDELTGYLSTYCIEIPQGVPEVCTTYQVVPLDCAPVPGTPVGMMGATKAAWLSELWGRYYDNAMSSPELSEAFAVAVYEIVYEDNSTVWDVTTVGSPGGRGFRCTGADTTTANLWLASLNGDGPTADLRALTNRERQDFIAEYEEPTGDIPEPATMLLLASGLAAGVAWRRRRRR
jgi:hypothetical protein